MPPIRSFEEAIDLKPCLFGGACGALLTPALSIPCMCYCSTKRSKRSQRDKANYIFGAGVGTTIISVFGYFAFAIYNSEYLLKINGGPSASDPVAGTYYIRVPADQGWIASTQLAIWLGLMCLLICGLALVCYGGFEVRKVYTTPAAVLVTDTEASKKKGFWSD